MIPELRGLHIPVPRFGDDDRVCAECSYLWPCDVVALLDERDALRDALKGAEYALNLAIEQRTDWQEESQEALNAARRILSKSSGAASEEMG